MLGKLSDLYGRRLIFQVTMGIFLVGSILCGASQSMGQLIAARAVQGLGGGGIQALAFAILGDVLPPRERGRYVGYFTLAFVGAALLGPLVGGFIIDHFSWPWIFYINVPFVIAVGAVCHFALRLPFQRRDAKLDYAGAALLSTSIACLDDRARGGPRRLDAAARDWCCSPSPRSSLVVFVARRAARRRAADPACACSPTGSSCAACCSGCAPA